MTRLAGVILTFNEEVNIVECIDSLRWTDRVIVFDSFSTDRTVALAHNAGAEVLQHQFRNYGEQRDAALQQVEAEWILFLDADERVTVELALEICEKLSRPERGWWIPRHNFIFGRLTLGAGWYPDYQLRLLHRKSAHYNTARPVHEEVILEGLAGYLENPITHYNYLNLQQFISKQEKYIDFEAGIRYEAGLRPKLWTYATMPFRQFVWRYLALQGWRMGLHGVRLSALMAYYEFQTWVRVRKRIGKRTL